MAFGKTLADRMALSRYENGTWSTPALVSAASLTLSPAAHALHYGSTCFEGLKAYRGRDGSPKIFRVDRHVRRMRNSAELLCIPFPDIAQVEAMIRSVVADCAAIIPEAPGALYLRPTLIGTEANIGAAGHPSSEAMLYVLASPVGDYFAGGDQGLRILVTEHDMRAVPGFGEAKAGGNYAAALRHVIKARNEHGAAQVLFCPNGDVQETGASNFFLLDDQRLVTKPLDHSFLPGVTRDSIITLARSLGYAIEERSISVREMLDWVKTGEAALSGTAAVFTGVGTLIHEGKDVLVRDGKVGPNTRRLKQALADIQSGAAADPFGWLS